MSMDMLRLCRRCATQSCIRHRRDNPSRQLPKRKDARLCRDFTKSREEENNE